MGWVGRNGERKVQFEKQTMANYLTHYLGLNDELVCDGTGGYEAGQKGRLGSSTRDKNFSAMASVINALVESVSYKLKYSSFKYCLKLSIRVLSPFFSFDVSSFCSALWSTPSEFHFNRISKSLASENFACTPAY